MVNSMRKLFLALKLLLNARKALIKSKSKESRIVIIDANGTEYLTPLFCNEPFEIIYTRCEQLYVNPIIILFTVINYIFRTSSLSSAYVLAVLKIIQPVIVVSFADNSGLLYSVCRLYPDARFISIQNGSRYLALENPPGSHQIYLTEFACFGANEVELFKSHGAQVDHFYPIGSLRDSYYRDHRKTISNDKKNHIYDLCLVSEFEPGLDLSYPEFLGSICKMTGYLKRFCETHKTSLCVATRSDPTKDKMQFEMEVDWCQKFAGENARIIPNCRKEFTTYQLIDASSVSVALCSTTLAEGFGRGNRIMACNFTGDRRYDFPLDGIWLLKNPHYESFEQRLLELLAITDQEFTKLYASVGKYLVNYDENMPTHAYLKNLIAEALNNRHDTSANKDYPI